MARGCRGDAERPAPGHAFEVPEVLSAKITDDDVADWSGRFAGTRA